MEHHGTELIDSPKSNFGVTVCDEVNPPSKKLIHRECDKPIFALIQHPQTRDYRLIETRCRKGMYLKGEMFFQVFPEYNTIPTVQEYHAIRPNPSHGSRNIFPERLPSYEESIAQKKGEVSYEIAVLECDPILDLKCELCHLESCCPRTTKHKLAQLELLLKKGIEEGYTISTILTQEKIPYLQYNLTLNISKSLIKIREGKACFILYCSEECRSEIYMNDFYFGFCTFTGIFYEEIREYQKSDCRAYSLNEQQQNLSDEQQRLSHEQQQNLSDEQQHLSRNKQSTEVEDTLAASVENIDTLGSDTPPTCVQIEDSTRNSQSTSHANITKNPEVVNTKCSALCNIL